MKAITKLMDDEPYFSTDILEILVTVSVFIFYFIVHFIISLFVEFTSSQFITNCIGLTVFTLFYYENKIVDFIEEHSIGKICDNNKKFIEFSGDSRIYQESAAAKLWMCFNLESFFKNHD